MPRKDAHGGAGGTISAQAQQDLVSEGIENFELPKSSVIRIAKAAIPDNVKLQKETVLSLVKGSTVFINYLAATAHSVAQSRQHKSVSASDVLKALEIMQFGDMTAKLQGELAVYRETGKHTTTTTTGGGGGGEPSSPSSGAPSKSANKKSGSSATTTTKKDTGLSTAASSSSPSSSKTITTMPDGIYGIPALFAAAGTTTAAAVTTSVPFGITTGSSVPVVPPPPPSASLPVPVPAPAPVPVPPPPVAKSKGKEKEKDNKATTPENVVMNTSDDNAGAPPLQQGQGQEPEGGAGAGGGGGAGEAMDIDDDNSKW